MPGRTDGREGGTEKEKKGWVEGRNEGRKPGRKDRRKEVRSNQREPGFSVIFLFIYIKDAPSTYIQKTEKNESEIYRKIS